MVFLKHLEYLSLFLSRSEKSEGDLAYAKQRCIETRAEFRAQYPDVSEKLKPHHALHFEQTVRRYTLVGTACFLLKRVPDSVRSTLTGLER